jgi:hypothetical protein
VAVTADTVRRVAELRARIASIADDRARSLTTAWAAAWDRVAGALTDAINEVLAQVAADPNHYRPSRTAVLSSGRLAAALEAIAAQLELLVGSASSGAAADVATAVGEAATAQGGIIASQLPPAGQLPAMLTARFAGAAPSALELIIERTEQDITSRLRPLPRLAQEAMRRELIRGMAVGDSPRTTAARMVTRAEGQFNGGLARAATIARTETLDAYRASSAAAQQAHADVLACWTWLSARSSTTCPGCWSKDGNRYPVETPGPWDHPNGECTRVPTTKTWRELGINLPEPPSVLGDARQIFDGLPEAEQLAIMGPARLELLRSGRVDWTDLATRRPAPDWRPSYVATPVRQLTVRAA